MSEIVDDEIRAAVRVALDTTPRDDLVEFLLWQCAAAALVVELCDRGTKLPDDMSAAAQRIAYELARYRA